MHGLITTYDNKKGTGRVQGDDGRIYFFTRDMVAKGEDLPYLMMDMEVSFDSAMVDGRAEAHELELTNPDSFKDKNVYYTEPSEFLCEKEDLVSGFDVLDRALYRLYRNDRTEERARRALIQECLSVNANSLVSYKVETQLKGALGYGYEVVTCSGVPVVLGRMNPNGEARAEDLKNSINQDRVKKLNSTMVNIKIGKMVIKALAAVLVVIFTLGFIFSGGL